ncbi:MAG: DUF4434 domain-containing protein [Armatimonadetes bacterium]|nr:DUF4434 domain-containing protein [Armatimonadota bacterium]
MDASVGPSQTPARCLPLISGALRQYDPGFAAREGTGGWRKELDDEQAIGFDLLWLANVPSALASQETKDPLLGLLDLCESRKIQAILDTGSTGHWYGSLDAANEIEVVGGYIREIARRYGSHPAFHAWYIPHEIYVAWGRMGEYIEKLYPALVEACQKAVPDKPVSLSPFFILDRDRVFGDFRYASPAEYQDYWARLIRRSRFDIIMLQDSGEHFSYVTDAEREPFFRAMKIACRSGGAHLWGNVETAEFECPSKEEYIRRYGRVHHSTVKNAPWRPVPIARLAGKLRLAVRFSDRIVTWGYNEFGRPHLGPKAGEWYQQYRAYYMRVAGKGQGNQGLSISTGHGFLR